MESNLEWFLPDPEGVSPIGPFSTDQIVEMLKNGKLNFDDFISCPEIKNESWQRFFEFKEFEHLFKGRPICPPPKLYSKGVRPKSPKEDSQILDLELEDIISEAKLSGEFIIHNNQNLMKGKVSVIAENFAEGETLKSDTFKTGDEVYFTVHSSPQVKSFSVLSVIVGKEKGKSNREFYKFYFLRINPEVKRRIHHYLQLSANKKELQV